MTHVKENPKWPDFVVNVDDVTKITEEEYRKLYLGEWIAEEEDNTQLSMIEEIKQVHLSKEPFVLSFGTPPNTLVTDRGNYKFDEESNCYVKGEGK